MARLLADGLVCQNYQHGERETDSVTMLTKEGFELRHEVFTHDAPEPVEETPEA